MKKTKDVPLGMHLLEIEITSACNLNCKHCYNRGKPLTHLPVESVIKLIKFAHSEGVKDLIITGGEALLHKDFNKIASYLLKIQSKVNRPRVVLQSNGVLMPKIDVAILKAFDLFHISFDITRSVRDKIGHITEAVNFLKRNNLDVYLFATLHKDNIHLIEDMIDIADKLEVQIGFNILQPSDKTRELGFTKQEYRDILENLVKLYKKERILRPSCPLVAIFDDKKRSSVYIGNKGGCVAGIASCTILPNGDVVPCAFFRIKSGNINEESLKTIWLNSKIFQVLRDRASFDNPCGSCDKVSFCGGCRSRAYKSTGRLTGPDPMCFKAI